MKLRTAFAGTVIAGLAVLGTAGTAFASTTYNPGTHPTSGPSQSDPSHQSDRQGCNQDTLRAVGTWNTDSRDTGKNCSDNKDRCQSYDQVRFTALYDRNSRDNCGTQTDKCQWLPVVRRLFAQENGRDACTVRYPWNQYPWNRNHWYCTSQLVVFSFPHLSHFLTETQGPWLHVSEVAFYRGRSYVITSVAHYGLGHDVFTIRNQYGQPVTNFGPPIRHGIASVRTCTIRHRR